LPGGVLGDVHRAVSHGRDSGDVGRGIRAVVWERTAGQLVQLALAAIVLFAFPSPVRAYLRAGAAVAAVAVAAALGAVLVSRALARRRRAGWTPVRSARTRWARALRTARADIRDGLLARRTWLRI